MQFAVLTVLSKSDTLDQVSIAHEIGADRNTVADVIRRLEKRGLLARPASVNDRRTKLAKITKLGQAFVADVQPAIIRAQKRLTDPISRDEYAVLTKIMQKLMKGNNAVSRAPMRPDSKNADAYTNGE